MTDPKNWISKRKQNLWHTPPFSAYDREKPAFSCRLRTTTDILTHQMEEFLWINFSKTAIPYRRIRNNRKITIRRITNSHNKPGYQQPQQAPGYQQPMYYNQQPNYTNSMPNYTGMAAVGAEPVAKKSKAPKIIAGIVGGVVLVGAGSGIAYAASDTVKNFTRANFTSDESYFAWVMEKKGCIIAPWLVHVSANLTSVLGGNVVKLKEWTVGVSIMLLVILVWIIEKSSRLTDTHH